MCWYNILSDAVHNPVGMEMLKAAWNGPRGSYFKQKLGFCADGAHVDLKKKLALCGRDPDFGSTPSSTEVCIITRQLSPI